MPGRFVPDTSIPARAIRRFVVAGIRSYQILVSPFFVGSCRFLPSCSDYATEAVERHGTMRGGALALRRLARCHPLCDGGHDPVPFH